MNDKKRSNRTSASDILRNRLIQNNANSNIEKDDGTKLSELGGIDYLMDDIKTKIYNVMFSSNQFDDMHVLKVRSVLIFGINGVGKKTLIKSFAREYKIPILHKIKFESCMEVKEQFLKAKNLEKAVILIDNLDQYEENKDIYLQINSCIENMRNSNFIVVLIHKDKNLPVPYDLDIFVKIPTVIERKEILEKMLLNTKKQKIDTEIIATYTPGFVAKDLERLVRIAGVEAVKRGVENDQFITMEDLHAALLSIKPIIQPLTFNDIGAMEKVKDELTLSILYPSKYPNKFKRLGVHKPSGILLHGPPGCGKTLIAKAVSNMSHCNFLSIKGPELITKYVGDSEKHLRDLFEKAKNLSPCVLFFDEIDSICSKRGKNEFGNRIVNQILTLLDGIEDRGEVYLIGATNRIDQIDSAMLRTGRFDKVIEVPLPEKEEAIEIFKTCVSSIPVENFNFSTLNFEGFSGADIAGVVKEAAFMCIKENFENDENFITREYFERAMVKIKNMKIQETLAQED
ncbi:ATPase AAA [Ecytonucleospora hepatopenaei]|uniref:ATPase AAA n=1 Tax=Ecytonucleospora hepatopenaei TaxID=646526 RepID=A0A1W0E476_9MICR|nr:ATPase AAA [Ecytonucleospora hepatopenaei]